MKHVKPWFSLGFALVLEALSVLAVFLTQTSDAAHALVGFGLVLQAVAVYRFRKDWRTAFALTAIALSSMIWFFYLAYSPLSLWPKVLGCLGVLVATGFAFHKMTGIDSFYGFLMVRSLAGFDVMQAVAKNHPKFSRWITDFGATMTFGLPWGWNTFGFKRVAGHALLLVFLLGVLALTPFFGAFRAPLEVVVAVTLLFGFIGFGMLSLLSSAYNVLTVPNAPPGVQLLIPGVTLPWESIFAIAVIAVVHEVAHGVLAYVEKLELKSSGVVLFGFLPVGAFVEPDEEKLDKLALEKKRRILVAGSTSNTLFFVVFFVLAFLASLLIPMLTQGVHAGVIPDNSTLTGLLGAGATLLSVDGKPVSSASDVYAAANATHNPELVFDDSGQSVAVPLMEVVITSVNPDYPASGVLLEGDRIAAVDGKRVVVLSDATNAIAGKNEGDAVVVTTQRGDVAVTLGNDDRIGVLLGLAPGVLVEDTPLQGYEWAYGAAAFLVVVLSLTYILNFLIAVVNVLPLFITDGQKILYYELGAWLGKPLAIRLSVAAGMAVLAIVLVNASPFFF